jgi:hypothetical protein
MNLHQAAGIYHHITHITALDATHSIVAMPTVDELVTKTPCSVLL